MRKKKWGATYAGPAAMGFGFAALLAGVTAPGLHAQAKCEFRHVVELSSAANGALDIDARSGGLWVEGVEGQRDIRVTATLCASTQEDLDDLTVELESTNSGVDLTTGYPEQGRGWRNRYARIDLDVTVPAGFDLDVFDRSGGVVLKNVGDVRVEDSSGELEIRGAGSVTVRDGSGDLTIIDADGDVEVDDGSGSLVIEGVGGSVRVDDGSGSVRVSRVGGDVWMGEIGSGSVRVADVEGSLTVERGRRSRIEYRDVGGEVDLPPGRRRGGRGGA